MSKNIIINNKLLGILNKKKGICVAIDLTKTNEIIKFIIALASEVSIFKLHCDIIDDFDDNFIEQLKILKKHYNILIWEDRKFSDIGFITNQQLNGGIYKISEWADIVTFHSTCGYKSIPIDTNLIIFLVVELSVEGHLCDTNYIEKSIQIANTHPNILGVVCQHDIQHLQKNILKIVPGISLNKQKKDNYNQIYNKIENKNFADIFVVGRSIIQSDNPLELIKSIQN